MVLVTPQNIIGLHDPQLERINWNAVTRPFLFTIKFAVSLKEIHLLAQKS